jgi:hypothetical protein
VFGRHQSIAQEQSPAASGLGKEKVMYRTSIFALLAMFVAAGWAQAQLPAISPPAGQQPSVSMGNPLRGTLLQNGNVMFSSPPRTSTPLPTLVNVPFRGTGNTFFFNGGMQQPPMSVSMGNPLQGTLLQNGNVLFRSTPRFVGLPTANRRVFINPMLLPNARR